MIFKVGVIGCGNISGIYFENCKKFPNLEVAACADLDLSRAEAKAKEFGVPKALSVQDLLGLGEIDVVLNLTVPKAHEDVSLAAIRAGKHVYSEKPLGTERTQGMHILEAASANGLRVGCAPDTFLGAGIQTCIELIDAGAIGRPVAATAFMLCHGHESWHPAPAFYYEKGGGPMLDMGPYYMTALVSMIGPIRRVAGLTSRAFDERIAASGETLPVEVCTHIAGLMEFANGAVGTIVTSFDVWGAEVPCIEIHGTEGSLSVPDPNGFGGNVKIRKRSSGDWEEVALKRPYAENTRGLGLADMMQAISDGRQTRASGNLAFHVLDVMEAFEDTSRAGRYMSIESQVERPAPMPAKGLF